MERWLSLPSVGLSSLAACSAEPSANQCCKSCPVQGWWSRGGGKGLEELLCFPRRLGEATEAQEVGAGYSRLLCRVHGAHLSK